MAALAAFAMRGLFTRYLTDDYCSAAVLHEHGILGAVHYQRAIWSGRFSYFAVKGVLESIGPVTARFVPALMITATAAAVAWTLRPLSPKWLFLSCSVAYAALASAPDRLAIYGAVTWETGAVTYMLPVILLLLWLGLFVRRGSIVAGAVLAFIAGGLSETSLAVQCVMAGGALLAALSGRDRHRARIALAGSIATGAALIIVISAPGNDTRAGDNPPRAPLTAAALLGLRHANDFVGSHLFLEGAPLLIAAVAGAMAGTPGARTGWIQASTLAVLCYLVSFLPAALAISAPAPPRALYVTNVCVVLAVFAACAALAPGMRPHPAVLALLAVLPLWSSATTLRTIPSARTYAMHVDAIEDLLHGQSGRDVVLRSPWALTATWSGPDSSHPANRCISSYFGLRSLKVVR